MFTKFWRPSRRRPQKRARTVCPRLECLEDRVTPATITVNTVVDTTNIDTFCSLREAITSINNQADVNGDVTLARVGGYASTPGGTPDIIDFDIPGAGVQSIVATSAEPTIIKPLTIDGYSQPGASANTMANTDNAVVLIQLDGSTAGAGVDGLTLGSGSSGSTLKGLDITSFTGNGIVIDSNGNNILGDFVGVTPDGSSQEPNGADGIRIVGGSNNMIGASKNLRFRNVISGNTLDGIHVEGTLATPATGNLIENNFVGVAADGKSSPLPFESGDELEGITVAADGNLWFTEFDNNALGRITPGGVVTEFSLAGLQAASGPVAIVSDPANNLLYFSESNVGQIGRINPLAGSDAAILKSETESPVVPSGAAAGLDGITLGPDGNLWFTEATVSRVGKVNPSLVTLTEFSTGITAGATPVNIVAGAGGALWFTELSNNAIGRITTAGAVTEFSLAALGAGTQPSAIASDPVNNWIYFIQQNTGRIGDINPLAGSDSLILASQAQSAVVPSGAGATVRGIAFGPDGNLWFTETNVDRVGNINPTLTTIQEFSSGIRIGAGPFGIVTGPDGALWFTENGASFIGRITTAGTVTNEIGLPITNSNKLAGIEISGGNDNTVGGLTSAARNVVGFNGTGIEVDNGGQANLIDGNYCGIGADGLTPAGNQQQGIVLRSSNGLRAPFGPAQANEPGVSFNQIGGTASGAGNVVEFNGTAGIAIFGNPVSASGQPNIGNAILGNTIFENGRNNPTLIELGIDLSNHFAFPADDGSTANDSRGHGGAADPNNFQDFPLLFAATQDSGNTDINGKLEGTPNSTFRIEFFANGADPLNGIAEAQQFLGFTNVTTGASGQAFFSVSLGGLKLVGPTVTATATDAMGNTSEVSAAVSILTADEHFVRAVYEAELGRAGTLAELDGWVAALHGPGSSTTAVASLIARAPEARDFLVRGWYVGYLGRSAAGGEEQGWVNMLLQGATEEQVLSQILASPEFVNRAQTQFSGTADQRFVEALYVDLLGRPASASEAAAWASQIAQLGRQGVALAITGSIEYRAVVFSGYYLTMLHRQADIGGLDGWVLSNLDEFSVRAGIEGSSEFYADG
jgi:CSLREA domain-containing protein